MSFAVLALVCGVALLGPLASLPRMGVPVVIGELGVGLLLGRTGVRVLDAENATFSFLAKMGFALVMFVAGTHVPVRDPALRRGLGAGALRALGVGLASALVAWPLSALFGTHHAALYAVVMASSSASMIIPALGGVPITTQAGLEMLAQVALADACCIVALPLVLDPAHALRAAAGAVVVLLAGAVSFVALRWLDRSGRRRRAHRLSGRLGLALELRVTLTLLFCLCAIAVTMHVSVMLAGFTAGLAVTASGEPRRLAKQTFALTEGLFAPLFFVWVGSSLDLRQVASHPRDVVLGLCLGLGALLAHGAMAAVRQPPEVALLTAAQLGVPVGAVALGRTNGLLLPGEGTALLLGALVTIAAVSVLARRVVVLVSASGSTSPTYGDAPRVAAPTQPKGRTR